MKIDRLIGILSILLQEEKVTAPELAERFEVSRRTINRDIESLCNAGIPISTMQGVGGGIQIMNGYKMDRTILSSRDMKMILAGLKSLDSVSGSQYYKQLMEKMKAGSSTEFVSGSESILIDLSSWQGEELFDKIEQIQQSIEERTLIQFAYYSPKSETERKIEPYFLIFKWSSWYVWGWCKSRNDFRLFKLNRMNQITKTTEQFQDRKVTMPDLSTEQVFPGSIRVKALFDASMKWHLMEEFGFESFEEQPNGKLLFEHDYTDQEYLIKWMLTCQDKVEVLEPEEIRNEILHIVKKIKEKYES